MPRLPKRPLPSDPVPDPNAPASSTRSTPLVKIPKNGPKKPTSVSGALKAGTEAIQAVASTVTIADDLTPGKAVALSLDSAYRDLEEQANRRKLALTSESAISSLSPGEVLLLDIRRTHEVVNQMARRLAPMLGTLPDPSELDPTDPNYEDNVKQTYNAFIMQTARGSRPHAFLELMLNFQKHLTNVSKSALDANIADRLATVAEQNSMDLIEVMKNCFNDEDLALTQTQRQAIPKVVRRHVEAFMAKRKGRSFADRPDFT